MNDRGSLVLMPGIIDSHVHVNEPGRTEWEGFYTAIQAAAAGGVTTIADMRICSVKMIILRLSHRGEMLRLTSRLMSCPS